MDVVFSCPFSLSMRFLLLVKSYVGCESSPTSFSRAPPGRVLAVFSEMTGAFLKPLSRP